METKLDKVTEEWLNSQHGQTKGHYRTWWNHFLEFTGMAGDEILASRKADKEYLWEAKVLAFKEWLLIEKKFSSYSTTAETMAIRGFFSYHRVALQFRRQEKARIGERTRQSEDYRFSLDDLKKMFDLSDLEERYVIAVGKSFGLRAGDFLRLTRGDLEPYINRPVPASIGEYKTQKKGVVAYPFIDADAQPIIKLVLDKIARDGRTKPSDRMLTFKKKIQLSQVLKRVAARAGINAGSKRVRFHCLRKFLIDRLSSYMSESKWKQVVGKAISESAYVSPDSLAEDYKRAMVDFTFTRPTIAEDQVRELARDELKKTLTPEQRELMEKGGVRFRKKNQAKATKLKEPCKDGHCQRIVTEEKLTEFLAQNWHMVATLPSGKIVIES